MSKAQKGNKENKKPKADKNQKDSCIGLQNGAGSGQTILQSVCEKNLRPDRKVECAGACSPRGNSDRDKLERSNLTGWAAHIALPLLGWPRSTAGPTK